MTAITSEFPKPQLKTGEVHRQENTKWKEVISKIALAEFMSIQLELRTGCSALYFPSSTCKNLSSKELKLIFDQVHSSKKVEFESVDEQRFDVSPLSSLGQIYYKEKIKALSLVRIQEISSEGITGFCHQARSIHTLKVVNCSLSLDVGFFSELFAYQREWKSITFIGRGTVDDACMNSFFLSTGFASRFKRFKYLKLVTTTCTVSEETKTKLKDRYPNLTFYISDHEPAIEPVPATTVTVIEPPKKVKKQGFWAKLVRIKP